MFQEVELFFQKSIVSTVFRLSLGLFFIVTGVLKIIDIPAFQTILRAFNILPLMWVEFISYLIPYTELTCGLMLLLNYKSAQASVLLSVLVLIFTTVSMISFFHDDIKNCGCYGNLVERENNLVLLFENSFIILGLFFTIKFKKGTE